jgi:hypothetical protein
MFEDEERPVVGGGQRRYMAVSVHQDMVGEK